MHTACTTQVHNICALVRTCVDKNICMMTHHILYVVKNRSRNSTACSYERTLYNPLGYDKEPLFVFKGNAAVVIRDYVQREHWISNFCVAYSIYFYQF